VLLGDEIFLKLAGPHRRIDGKESLVLHRLVDFGGDRIQPTDAFAYYHVGAGKRVCQDTVGLSGRGVLPAQGCLPFLNGS
jgi:hypothetical protein